MYLTVSFPLKTAAQEQRFKSKSITSSAPFWTNTALYELKMNTGFHFNFFMVPNYFSSILLITDIADISPRAQELKVDGICLPSTSQVSLCFCHQTQAIVLVFLNGYLMYVKEELLKGNISWKSRSSYCVFPEGLQAALAFPLKTVVHIFSGKV